MDISIATQVPAHLARLVAGAKLYLSFDPVTETPQFLWTDADGEQASTGAVRCMVASGWARECAPGARTIQATASGVVAQRVLTRVGAHGWAV